MSVMLIENAVFDRVAYKMQVASTRRIVDDSYFHCCRDLTGGIIDDYVNRWYQLNVRSWCVRYDETELLTIRSWSKGIGKPANTSQFLKWLDCIDYNIEISSIEAAGATVSNEDKGAVAFLKLLTNDTMRAIVGTSKAYATSLWGEVPE